MKNIIPQAFHLEHKYNRFLNIFGILLLLSIKKITQNQFMLRIQKNLSIS